VSVDPLRRRALEALLAVSRGKSLAGELSRLRRGLPPGRDAGVAEELVRGVLQWQARYDHLVRHFSRRRAVSDPTVRGVLHLALHQLLSSRSVPPHAAVHQAGELARAVGRSQAVGYVNAVLQSVKRHADGSAEEDPLAAVHDLFVDPAGEPAAYLAAWWSHPEWLVRRWLERFGDAETALLLSHANTPAPVTMHVLPGRDPQGCRTELLAAGAASEPVAGFPRALRLTERRDRAGLRDLLATVDGLLIQDAGAQAAVDWLTRDGADLAAVEAPVVDLCAAPGGKAVHLRTLLSPAQNLVALDLRPRRLARIRENRDRLNLTALPLVAGDGCRPPFRPGSCAAVLLDGPCSGTGVGRHHPEGRWRLEPDTFTANGGRLLALAGAAAELLVPGGRLYYATCSLEVEENESVIAALLDQTPELEPDPDPDGRYERQWLPWRTGTDGFYAARLRRRRSVADGVE